MHPLLSRLDTWHHPCHVAPNHGSVRKQSQIVHTVVTTWVTHVTRQLANGQLAQSGTCCTCYTCVTSRDPRHAQLCTTRGLALKGLWLCYHTVVTPRVPLYHAHSFTDRSAQPPRAQCHPTRHHGSVRERLPVGTHDVPTVTQLALPATGSFFRLRTQVAHVTRAQFVTTTDRSESRSETGSCKCLFQ